MRIENEFTVAASPEAVWELLTDVERIAPCVPGFQLLEIEGDEYRGLLKVKLGAVKAEYRCRLSFVEKDAHAQRALIRAEGREIRGHGGLVADVTSTLRADGAATAAALSADVSVNGRLAGSGRGFLAEVSARMTKQFAECLERQFLGPS